MALLDDPSKGEIKIDKIETKNLSDVQKDKLRRDFISIIFQDNNLLTDFTAIENIMMPLIIRNEEKKTVFKKAEKILDYIFVQSSSHQLIFLLQLLHRKRFAKIYFCISKRSC